jgi:hypothetical protein
MIYDLNLYRDRMVPIVKNWIEMKGEPPITQIPELALNTSCEIIMISHYVGELYGYTPELKKYIQDLMDFYRPDGIIGETEHD